MTALSTGQRHRHLAAALLVAAGSFSANGFVVTLVAAVTLTIIMHHIAAEWGRRSGTGAGAGPAAAADS